MRFVSVFSCSALAQRYKNNADQKQKCFFLLTSTYILQSIEIGLVSFGYIDKETYLNCYT